ncbi:GGDEF domain-containing response regulator [Aminipila luticellarii]|uniref:Stage 0 sporulation protein A homolog n=1 Tax=Aminipila luticellarii TaxID=2507160 RepID=A0A410PY09_9FIRM|nr:diguanylate cyclase [Aminipila luticellarii]QAT43843.1 diguanylate cyclase [Aminipila luticellarii]
MKSILVVDDSQFNLMVVQKALEKDYEVNTRLNGIEGIKFAKNNPVDLILLDIDMPELSGIDTIKILKKDPRLAKTPIIFLTGLSDHEVERTCLNLGARDFITKPFNEPVILQRIKMILELEDLRKNLERQVRYKTEELEKLTAKIIKTFANSMDPITELWSRMYIEEKVNAAISQFSLAGALVVLNIDNFRLINDALGYEQGNVCLKTVGRAILNTIKEPEIAARSSADEFLVYLPKVSTKEEARIMVKEIFKEAENLLEKNKFYGITVSAGIAMTLETGEYFNSLYYYAEKALHHVKVNGKNGIAIHSQKEE